MPTSVVYGGFRAMHSSTPRARCGPSAVFWCFPSHQIPADTASARGSNSSYC
ncbi:hypothetical protein T261_4608 [Streptomyces lydicus]|nr:hypothetical protein T261_4608 [Streptomyces lydicus]